MTKIKDLSIGSYYEYLDDAAHLIYIAASFTSSNNKTQIDWEEKFPGKKDWVKNSAMIYIDTEIDVIPVKTPESIAETIAHGIVFLNGKIVSNFNTPVLGPIQNGSTVHCETVTQTMPTKTKINGNEKSPTCLKCGGPNKKIQMFIGESYYCPKCE